MLVYRGTQSEDLGRTVRGQVSWTPSRDVAKVYAARPGTAFGSGESAYPRWLDSSTLHTAKFQPKNLLDVTHWGTWATMYDVAKLLKYGKPDGLTGNGLRRIFNYLNNRLTGRAPGGEFVYFILNEDGEIEDEGLSFRSTPIKEFRDDVMFENDLYDGLDPLTRLGADVYVFADAPAFQAAALRLGHDAFAYTDVFQAEHAVSHLLNKEIEDLDGVDEYDSAEGGPDGYEDVYGHVTFRPLVESALTPVKSVPIREANPRKRRPSKRARGLMRGL